MFLWHTTYLVASLEALSLNSTVLVGLDTDTSGVHRAKHIVDLADQLLVGSVDHAGKEGHTVAVNHSDNVALASVRESGNLNDGHRGTLLETAEAASAATEAASAASATSVTTAETASVASSEATSSSSWFKSHFLVLLSKINY